MLSGTHVVLLSRDHNKLARIRDELLKNDAKHDAKVFIVQVDLGKPAETRQAVRQALKLLGGKLDFLVNNGPGYNWQVLCQGLLSCGLYCRGTLVELMTRLC